MNKGWHYHLEGSERHVWPQDDIYPHVLDGGICTCGPRIDMSRAPNVVIIHNSFDGREYDEERSR